MLNSFVKSGNALIVACAVLLCGILTLDILEKRTTISHLEYQLEQCDMAAQMQCESELTACTVKNVILQKMIAKCALYDMAERMEKR